MTVDAWLALAVADTERRGLPEMKPLLEALAQAMRTLRRATFNDDARGPWNVHPGASTDFPA